MKLLVGWLLFRRFTLLKWSFSHIATWKQEMTNLWNRDRKSNTGPLAPQAKSLTTTPGCWCVSVECDVKHQRTNLVSNLIHRCRMNFSTNTLWLVVSGIYVASAVFQPYRNLKAGDNQSLEFKWRGRESNPRPLAPQAKSLTTRPLHTPYDTKLPKYSPKTRSIPSMDVAVP